MGKRTYIRGADLVVNFLEGADAVGLDFGPEATIRLLRLVRQVSCDGAWQTAEHLEPSATLDLQVGGKVKRFYFVESREAIFSTAPDIASRVMRLDARGDFYATALLRQPATVGELLDGIIEANKRSHEVSLRLRNLPTDTIRFVYVEKLPISLSGVTNEVKIELVPLGERERQGRHFTAVQVKGLMGSDPTVLCFSTN